jgi:hypothetical protein
MYVFVTIFALASAAVAYIADNTMPGIIEQLALIQNSDLMSEIVISSALLVIITLVGILSIIGNAYFAYLVVISSKSLRHITHRSDTP